MSNERGAGRPSGKTVMIEAAEKETPLGISIARAAQLLGTSERQIYRLIGTGELEAYWIGRARRITRRSIERFVYGDPTARRSRRRLTPPPAPTGRS